MFNIIKGIVRGILFFVFRLKIVDSHKVLVSGGAILAVNHKSNWDPVIAALATPRKMRFMAKKELFSNKLFGKLITHFGAFPVERGRGDIGAIKAAMKMLKDGEMILIFPEGTRVRKDKESKAKTGAVMLATHSDVPIIPVYISGKYRWMSKITIKFGDPVSYSEFKGEKLSKDEMQTLADKLLETINSLRV